MTGRIPVPLWTWAAIAKYYGVDVRKARAWKEQGAPIVMTEKGAYAEAWRLSDWLYAQPEAEPNRCPGNLTHSKT
jgi:phage terminase Nu1 subunit (DNA packaging protein)